MSSSNSPASSETQNILIGDLALPGELVGRVYVAQYMDRSPAIVVTCIDEDGGFEEPYGKFSICLGADTGREEGLRPWEFMAKTYSENEPLTACMAASPWFEPVLGVKLVQLNHASVPTWRMKPAAMSEDVRNAIIARMGWPASFEREPVRPTHVAPVQRLQAEVETNVHPIVRDRQRAG